MGERFRAECNAGAALRPKSRQTTVCQTTFYYTNLSYIAWTRLHCNVLSCMDKPESVRLPDWRPGRTNLLLHSPLLLTYCFPKVDDFCNIWIKVDTSVIMLHRYEDGWGKSQIHPDKQAGIAPAGAGGARWVDIKWPTQMIKHLYQIIVQHTLLVNIFMFLDIM